MDLVDALQQPTKLCFIPALSNAHWRLIILVPEEHLVLVADSLGLGPHASDWHGIPVGSPPRSASAVLARASSVKSPPMDSCGF